RSRPEVFDAIRAEVGRHITEKNAVCNLVEGSFLLIIVPPRVTIWAERFDDAVVASVSGKIGDLTLHIFFEPVGTRLELYAGAEWRLTSGTCQRRIDGSKHAHATPTHGHGDP